MVCNRCIMVVQNELDKLGLNVKKINLGEVVLDKEITSEEKNNVDKVLIPLGFELIDDKKSPSYSIVFFSQFSLFSKYTSFFLLVNRQIRAKLIEIST